MTFLSETELAERAGTTRDRVRELIVHRILQREGDDAERPYRQVDVNRIRLAEALEHSGLSLTDLGKAIAEGHVALDFLDQLVAQPPRVRPGQDGPDLG